MTQPQKSNSHPHLPHVVFEYAERAHSYVEKAHSGVEKVNTVMKIRKGSQAFRRYNWIKSVPNANKVGNLRGMVIDKRARVAYDLIVENGEKLEKFGKALFIAGVAIEIKNNLDNLKFSQDSGENLQRILLIPSLAIMKVVGGIVPMGAHVAAKSTEYACRISGAECVNMNDIKSLDAIIQQSYDRMMDPEEVLHYINTNLVFR